MSPAAPGVSVDLVPIVSGWRAFYPTLPPKTLGIWRERLDSGAWRPLEKVRTDFWKPLSSCWPYQPDGARRVGIGHRTATPVSRGVESAICDRACPAREPLREKQNLKGAQTRRGKPSRGKRVVRSKQTLNRR